MVQGAGQGQHFYTMELFGLRHTELKGKAEHQIVQYRNFCYIAVRHFFKDKAALRPMQMVQELSVLVIVDF